MATAVTDLNLLIKNNIWPLKMGPIGSPETSEANYQCTLRKIPVKSENLNTRKFCRNPV